MVEWRVKLDLLIGFGISDLRIIGTLPFFLHDAINAVLIVECSWNVHHFVSSVCLLFIAPQY